MFARVTVTASDLAASRAFYETLLGGGAGPRPRRHGPALAVVADGDGNPVEIL